MNWCSPVPWVDTGLLVVGYGAGVAGGLTDDGTWPDDERWWDPDRASGRTARAQVLLDGDPGTALLLCYRQRRWYLEGSYE